MTHSQQSQQLTNDARSAMQQTPSVRNALADLRASLVTERQTLIKQELALYEIV